MGRQRTISLLFRIVEAKRAVGHSEWEAVNKVKCEQVWRNTEEVCLNVLRKPSVLPCETSIEHLSQRKAIGMLTDKHSFQKSPGICRTGLFASTVLPLMVMLMLAQSVLPAYAATTRTAPRFTTPSYGCTSPAACVSKMTLVLATWDIRSQTSSFSKNGCPK